MPHLFFEDFHPGRVAVHDGPTITRDDIVTFGREFDPQPFHTDEEAAKETFARGLVASGWHTCALTMRAITDGFLLDSSAMGAPGIEEVKWLRPVRPDDRLRMRTTVLEARASRSRPNRGSVRFRVEALNQRDEPVMAQLNWIMFGSRDASPRAEAASAAIPRSREDASPTAELNTLQARAAEQNVDTSFFEELELGQVRRLGSHLFTPDDIVRFARRFDPQPFHVDAQAAEASHFGALCASGWHTAATWMRLMVAHRTVARQRALDQGRRPAHLGLSPGFKDLKWLKPVYAGDTITYRSTLVDKRISASRPGWGLVFHRNTGDNQHGTPVFEFTGAVFWERQPA